MSIPDYQIIMLPLLKLVAKHGSIKLKDAVTAIADEFKLTEQEQEAMILSGVQTIIYNRVCWANTYLRKAGLLTSPQRGVLDITKSGKEVLAENLPLINVKYLTKFPEFIGFYTVTKEDEGINASETSDVRNLHTQLKKQVLDDIVNRLKSCSSKLFENLVVDIIVKMGYGNFRKDAGKTTGKSGDEGIDGIINEDKLGLNVIYIQAKRWEGKVGRPEVQKFAGALQGKHAKKGVLITTSDFTTEACDFVKHIDSKIILISGKELAELMWEHNIGLNISVTYEVKKLDLAYFNE